MFSKIFGESKEKNLSTKGFIIFGLNPVELSLWLTFEITMSVSSLFPVLQSIFSGLKAHRNMH